MTLLWYRVALLWYRVTMFLLYRVTLLLWYRVTLLLWYRVAHLLWYRVVLLLWGSSPRKKSLNSRVLERTWMTLFMKQVLPRLSRPVKPGCTTGTSTCCLFNGCTLAVGFCAKIGDRHFAVKGFPQGRHVCYC